MTYETIPMGPGGDACGHHHKTVLGAHQCCSFSTALVCRTEDLCLRADGETRYYPTSARIPGVRTLETEETA